ncbi:hypothetical protein M426DRAFT_104187 [Hypoxylon sp. CI-4A]|nr:hypothetical protein M426DRAFT_104187 [Hypoxylon sp. CI-4A]
MECFKQLDQRKRRRGWRGWLFWLSTISEFLQWESTLRRLRLCKRYMYFVACIFVFSACQGLHVMDFHQVSTYM